MDKPNKHALDFYLLMAIVVAVNSLLWLDSFDRYLSSRYHFYLSQYLPDSAYVPSREMQMVLALEDKTLQSGQCDAAGHPDEVYAGKTDGSAQASPGETDLAAASAPGAVSELEPYLAVASAVPIDKPGLASASVPSAEQVGKTDTVGASAPARQPTMAQQLASGALEQPASAPATNGQPEQGKQMLTVANPRVLFAGDSMMQGIAPLVISRMRKAYPQGLFVDLSKQSTGLTTHRYFDWPAKIKNECIKQGFRTVVIFLGPNDPWDIYEGKKRYTFPSESWEKKYRSRVNEILDFAVLRGLRVIWIGLPVMRDERVNLGAKIENKIFQEETLKFKFDYLPTADLLGSFDEPYKKYIENTKKRKLVVRADDGVHFTSLGARMISLQVEELLKKQEKL